MPFQIGDKVQFVYHKEEQEGYVEDIEKDGITVSIFENDTPKIIKLSESKLSLIPPYPVSEEELRQFVRCEIDEKTLRGGSLSADLEGDATYSVCIDDLLAMLNHYLNVDDMEEARRHLETVDWELDSCFSFGDPQKEHHNPDFKMRGMISDNVATSVLFSSITSTFVDKDGDVTKEDISALLRKAEHIKNNFGKPFEEREFSDEEKKDFLIIWGRNDNGEVNRAADRIRQTFKRFTEELAEKDNPTALHCLGYGCYSGCEMWEQDWIRSRDCFLKLMKLCPDNRFYANSLGYIYYYGRCNGGVPEYEKAYRYFSLAAFGGVYEAEYKIADMFEYGYGVEKNELISEKIISRLYGENILFMFEGEYGSKFADIALRMSHIETRNHNDYVAYAYALQASFAIRQRMKKVDHYGDSSVASAIEETLAKAKETLNFKPERRESSPWLYAVLGSFKSDSTLCQSKIVNLINGDVKLTITLFPKQENKRMFLTLPDVGFCGMTDKIVVTAKGVNDVRLKEEKVLFDSVQGNSLMCNGETVLHLDAARFEIAPPKEDSGNLLHFASVEFRPGGKPYDYICEDTDVAVGDQVTVITKEGEQTVTIVRIFDKHESELALPVSRYKKIENK